jgi:pyruvate,water dikinase
MLGFDSAPLRAERSLYDLARWAREQPALADALAAMPREEFAALYHDPAARGAAGGAWPEFWRRLDDHLARFGHAIYDLDFAKAVLADDPAPVLETLRFFMSGQAPDPYARQAAAEAAREQAVATVLGRRGLRAALVRRLAANAQRFAPLREDALADVGLGWPAARRMLRELGRRLVAAGAIGAADDVFWLTMVELREAATELDAGRPPADHHAAVAERRATWERERALTPPVALPLKGGTRFLGIDFSRVMPARADQPADGALRGIAASPGRVTGPARVIHGPEEFGQMRHGDILVARITTPAWTPLFALAAGVVTDVGGPLSHGSIVAREYHIPAVLGTGAATERLISGQPITVDGDAGTVTVSA